MKQWFDSPVIFTDINGKKIKFERGFNEIPIMIDARQVRIGNYLKPYHGDYVVVTAIQGDGRIIHTPNSIGAVNDIMVEGIPLTKELLTDWLGFEEAINKTDCYVLPIPAFYETLQFGIDYKEGSDVIVVAKGSMGWAVTGKYLHQLQNLYFALTGTELEIKIPTKA